jgi:beta-glucanase (GH16 family)
MKRTLLVITFGLLFAQSTIAAEPSPSNEKRPTKIWNRSGPLGDTPKRVTDASPLSDQDNKDGWIKFEPMSDEFEGKELDQKKWVMGIEGWKGRQPALFSDKNVTVSDGKLHLTMRKEKLPPEVEKLGYKDYTSAALHTKARSSYGYYEVKAKPMNSGGSSSFWFCQDETPGWGTEIDVFEIGGQAKGFEHKYNMTLHVTQTPQEKKHWQVGGVWITPWRLADDYHVYGFDWGKDELRFYVDGVLVRSVENTHWHQPLYLIFDSETMPEWTGMPEDKDLPSTFSIEYVRSWRKDAKEPKAVSNEATLKFPKIDRQPAANKGPSVSSKATSIPKFNRKSPRTSFQVDLRGKDLSGLNLSGSLNDLLYATFDNHTVWPPADKMPKEYDRQRILDLGKNPGLGVRGLHARGITGRGVGLAIIDQPLLVEHREYKDRLRLYEEINVKPDMAASMHGAAVASIAVGQTIGVAPGADLYYIGSWTGDFGGLGGFTFNFRYYAEALRRVLEINRQLPADHKIRVVAMQVGWSKNQKNYEEITAACNEAKVAGLFLVSSSLEEVHGFKFHGIGRAPLADPDKFESYEPGLFWAYEFRPDDAVHMKWFVDRLLVPMDSRTLAGFMGADDYFFCRQGGWSWSIPYIAGTYALACQADPTMTSERFWKLALKTGRTILLKHGGKDVPFGPIIDPVALIKATGRK